MTAPLLYSTLNLFHAIKETLDGIFPAVPYCIDLIGGPYIETHDSVCKVFRPKSALAPGSRTPA